MAEMLHLKLQFNNSGTKREAWYGLSADVILALATWENSLSISPDAAEIAKWLDKNGAVLDRADGPAITDTYEKTITMMYYNAGKLNRGDDKPAITMHMGESGTLRQEWWENGLATRKGKPAVVTVGPGATTEEYFLDGKRFREDGLPNLVQKGRNGSVEEQWLDEKGSVIQARKKPGLMNIPGVTLVA